MRVLSRDEPRVSWDIFEREAASYEDWYATRRGRQVDQAERALLDWLLAQFPAAESVLEVGCGTGHFTQWLAEKGLGVAGLDRAPAMLAEMRRRYQKLPVVLGDAHRLPFHEGVVDLTIFVTTLEFLDDPFAALSEAVRVAGQGVIVLVLNRWSLGGLSRRWGPQVHHRFLGQARDYTIARLMAMVRKAAGQRWREVRWASTLFPNGFWSIRAPIPLGDVIGMAVRLAPPAAPQSH